jgi:mRNA interferase RelE/StbE
MAAYRVAVKPSVEKDLRSVSKAVVGRVVGAIDRLGTDPFPRSCVKLASTEGLYRIRVGQYRVIYAVDRGARLVTVHYVRHR